VPHGRIVVVGHGTGHSDASSHLVEWLHSHDSETWRRVAREVAADLPSLTAPQLLDLGREALSHPGAAPGRTVS